jgi:glutathione S-transferase
MLGEMPEASYGKVNARHKTPVLISGDGRTLNETMAIARWLEVRDAERRVSSDPLSSRADQTHQLIAHAITGFTGAFSPLWTAMEMVQPEPAYQATPRRYGAAAVTERHDKLEAKVDDTAFAVGEQPTLADAVLVGVARWLEVHVGSR